MNRLASCSSRHFTGGWRIPPSAAKQQQPYAVERVQVPIRGSGEPLELCFKQRFTVTPGSVSSNDMTGTWVWPTARQMVERLQSDLNKLRGDSPLRILELGSGCGLLGMSLAATGDEVVLTDHAENIKWLRENVELNQNVVGNRATTAVLQWGNEKDMVAVEKKLGDSHFDVIVGSDLIYDPSSHRVLKETMQRFAMPNRAPVFLGYPDRGSSEPDFFCIAKENFNIEIMPMGSDESNLMYAVCQIRP